MENKGSVGWAFWDVKGGFQKVRSDEVLVQMAQCDPLWSWRRWLERFMF